MRLGWAIVGLVAVAACGPTTKNTPKTTEECQSYAASRAGLSFSTAAEQNAYFNTVITQTHGGNASVRPTYLSCLDKIGALPEGVMSQSQTGYSLVSERSRKRSDLMSGGAGYKVVYLRSEAQLDMNTSIFGAADKGTIPLPMTYAELPGGAALWGAMSQEQQVRVLSFLSQGDS